ncbi:MAG: ATP-dependent helicase DinG [Gammaproteobacteria bacterium]|jgi:ATP-dependent DNA helicase DinG|nr:ATP-dependent helicase DinG [Gammaproteobacteria bacterium]
MMNLKEALAKLKEAKFEERTGQVQMMQAVTEALNKKTIAVIEGGTGIGKTFAYLVPLLLQRPEKLKLVISTATVSLQEQLVHHDLPNLSKILGLKFTAEIAKGRRRYVCLNKLYHFDRGITQSELNLLGFSEAKTELPKQEEQALVETLIDKIESRQWNGDRDQLNTSIPDNLWRNVTTDAVGCSNKRCSFFNDCSFFQAKRRLYTADIIVTNHDLLLSDIGLGTGALLPPAQDCFYVIDEAHHLAGKAIKHFTAYTGIMSAIEWLDQLSKGMKSIQQHLKLEQGLVNQIEKSISEIKECLPQLRDVIAANFSHYQRDSFWLLPKVPEALQIHSQVLATKAKELLLALYAIRKMLTEQHDEKTLSEYDSILSAIGYFIGRSEDFSQTFNLFCAKDPEGIPPIARWISAKEEDVKLKNYQGKDYICHAAMSSAASMLPNYFWDKLEHGAALCSATLRALGKFEDFLENTGLQYYPHVKTHAFASPFPYEKSTLCVPKLNTLPESDKSEKFIEEISELLPELLRQEPHGSLVLFTSRDMMEKVYHQLDSKLQKQILLQGTSPKHLMIESHKSLVDQGKPSIIFGLQSFAEGVDLPGNYCKHVIITKLPFSVPSTPIEKTRVDWLEAQGRNAFMEHTLPEASIRLTQYVGRLIRSQEDCGQITILDRRVVLRRYGKQLLDSLPAFTRQIS